jgi:hypothetical protein
LTAIINVASVTPCVAHDGTPLFITSVNLSLQICDNERTLDFLSHRSVLPQIVELDERMKETNFQQNLTHARLSEKPELPIYQRELDKELLQHLQKTVN